jgi:hypothetical protein
LQLGHVRDLKYFPDPIFHPLALRRIDFRAGGQQIETHRLFSCSPFLDRFNVAPTFASA